MNNEFDFSEALQRLKDGGKIQRKGWNGKGMFLFLNPSNDIRVSEGRPLAYTFDIGTPLHINAYIMMKTADEKLTIVPWLASQSDLLAEDWRLV